MANETVYNIAKTKFLNGTLDWDTADIRCLLFEGTVAAAAYNPDNANLTACLTGSAEASGTGYVRKSLAGRSVSQDDANNRAKLLATAPVWTGANWGTGNAILIYLHVDGTNANDVPISFHDEGFPVTTNGGDLTVNFAGAGNNEVAYLT